MECSNGHAGLGAARPGHHRRRTDCSPRLLRRRPALHRSAGLRLLPCNQRRRHRPAPQRAGCRTPLPRDRLPFHNPALLRRLRIPDLQHRLIRLERQDKEPRHPRGRTPARHGNLLRNRRKRYSALPQTLLTE